MFKDEIQCNQCGGVAKIKDFPRGNGMYKCENCEAEYKITYGMYELVKLGKRKTDRSF